MGVEVVETKALGFLAISFLIGGGRTAGPRVVIRTDSLSQF